MKRCSRCGETKPAEAFHRNASQPGGLAKQCISCRKAIDAEDYAKNKAARAATRKAYRQAHPEVGRECGKRLHAAKPELYRARAAAYRSRKRRCRFPDDREAIAAVYKLAIKCRELGIACHVDHIVPLKGKNVCGLHVSWNLQLLADDENLAKSNRFVTSGVMELTEDLNSPCN